MTSEVKNTLNIDDSINYWSSRSFDEYCEWIDQNIKVNKFSTLFLFFHLQNFLSLHSSTLSYDKYIYLEKQFECSLELKLLDWANKILLFLIEDFGFQPKIQRLQAQLLECEGSDQQLDRATNIYKSLIYTNIEDRPSVKRFLMHLKSAADYDELKILVSLWNDYLKVNMDDQDAWFELSEIYIKLSNYKEALYCLEEILLHFPYNCNVYQKIGDISATIGSQESLSHAIKYYSQALLIKPTPRAFWGLIFAINTLYKNKKTVDEKHRQIFKIAKVSLETMYNDSPTMKDIKINDLIKVKFD